jgi:hypothetical protein
MKAEHNDVNNIWILSKENIQGKTQNELLGYVITLECWFCRREDYVRYTVNEMLSVINRQTSLFMDKDFEVDL